MVRALGPGPSALCSAEVGGDSLTQRWGDGVTIKLNLGCGTRKRDGFVNVDISAVCEPDEVVDLEAFPWPWADDSVDFVLMSHVLEHLGGTTAQFLGIMKELYRVCVHGAEIQIHVPHPRHDEFLADPTHVRPILPATMSLFSRQSNLEWQRRGLANTTLALYLDVDFELGRVNMHLEDRWRELAEAGKLTRETLEAAIQSQNNVVKQIDMTLRVLKDGGEG